MSIKVLALDLERTLITNVINRHPRPGLRDFLTFCMDNFQRVVIMTGVDEKTTWDTLQELAEINAIPRKFVQQTTYIKWEGEHKDLRYVPGADVSEILILDDYEGYIHPEQKSQWIPVEPYDPPGVNPWQHRDAQEDFTSRDSDRVLYRLKEILEMKLENNPK